MNPWRNILLSGLWLSQPSQMGQTEGIGRSFTSLGKTTHSQPKTFGLTIHIGVFGFGHTQRHILTSQMAWAYLLGNVLIQSSNTDFLGSCFAQEVRCCGGIQEWDLALSFRPGKVRISLSRGIHIHGMEANTQHNIWRVKVSGTDAWMLQQSQKKEESWKRSGHRGPLASFDTGNAIKL